MPGIDRILLQYDAQNQETTRIVAFRNSEQIDAGKHYYKQLATSGNLIFFADCILGVDDWRLLCAVVPEDAVSDLGLYPVYAVSKFSESVRDPFDISVEELSPIIRQQIAHRFCQLNLVVTQDIVKIDQRWQSRLTAAIKHCTQDAFAAAEAQDLIDFEYKAFQDLAAIKNSTLKPNKLISTIYRALDLAAAELNEKDKLLAAAEARAAAAVERARITAEYAARLQTATILAEIFDDQTSSILSAIKTATAAINLAEPQAAPPPRSSLAPTIIVAGPPPSRQMFPPPPNNFQFFCPTWVARCRDKYQFACPTRIAHNSGTR